MPSAFTGLLAGDFDAYSAEKWSSNMWNRQRLEVKQRMLALGKELAVDLAGSGLELTLGASDEHPSLWNRKRVDCQWLFLWRNEEERKVLETIVDRDRKLAATILDPTPLSRHAFLGVKLDVHGLELALEVHRNAWVDAKNLRSKLSTTAGKAQMLRLLAELPEGFTFGAGEQVVPAAEVDAERIPAVLAEHESSEWFFVAVRIARDEAIVLGPALGDAVAEAFRRLGPIYRFVAWSRQNDFVSIDQALAQQVAERQVAHEVLESEEREREERLQAERDLARERAKEKGHGAARATGATSWVPPRPPRAAVEATVEPSRKTAPARAVPAPRGATTERAETRQAVPPAASRGPGERSVPKPPAAPPVVDKGVRVRIGTGPFAGKVGTVQEVDKGVAKVLLGLLAARVDVQDLVPVGVAAPGRRS
ncbi:MAG: hypothetical protein HYY06_21210 [Deltaproteobacteria bacterium]|nr:hypothetical protein [Deltaproteobacteria bacterium]